MKLITILYLLSISLSIYSQESEEKTIDLELTSFCHEEESVKEGSLACSPLKPDAIDELAQNLNGVMVDPEKEKAKVCQTLKNMALTNQPPVETKIIDDRGGKWKIRFHFGHSRMFGSIRPTDMKIKSTALTTTIKNFEFDERTSDKYFNPTKWNEIGDATKWIDEPSNTMTLSIENRKNAFFITAYHPKMLKTYIETPDASGTGVNYASASENVPNNNLDVYRNNLPDGTKGVHVQNTHKNMVWQIGYGRKFTIFEGKKGGSLTYIPRVDVGIQTGTARTIYFEKGKSWDEKWDGFKVQGYNASVGHRVEYQKGKIGIFVDQRLQYGKIKHGFLDGEASYTSVYSPVTFGVSIDIITLNKNKK